jgi:hypothetical protein
MKKNWWKWLLGINFILLPPLLISLSLVIEATLSFQGVCPGVMDIPDYPCTMLEFIARNTVSAFALPVHLFIWLTWVPCALAATGLVALVVWLLSRRRAKEA